MTTASDNWGRWGDQDEHGALNLLTPAMRLDALKVPRTGTLYRLGSAITREGLPSAPYRSAPQRLTLINDRDEPMLEVFGARGGVGSIEDVVQFGSHTGTHMDALSHIYADGAIYNGFAHTEQTTWGGAARCGIEKAGPIVTRGVLVDVAGHQSVPALAPGHVISLDEFLAAADAQGVVVQQGDAVLIRTGWYEQFRDRGGDVASEQPGIGVEVARFLGAADVTVVGADNTAVEAMPFDEDAFVPVHIELLVRRGIHMIEHLRLESLAADSCSTFLFGAAPLPVVGATASPVDPFAIG
jgi:kynurenine formamidase